MPPKAPGSCAALESTPRGPAGSPGLPPSHRLRAGPLPLLRSRPPPTASPGAQHATLPVERDTGEPTVSRRGPSPRLRALTVTVPLRHPRPRPPGRSRAHHWLLASAQGRELVRSPCPPALPLERGTPNPAFRQALPQARGGRRRYPGPRGPLLSAGVVEASSPSSTVSLGARPPSAVPSHSPVSSVILGPRWPEPRGEGPRLLRGGRRMLFLPQAWHQGC